MTKSPRLVRLSNPIDVCDGKHFAVDIETDDTEPFKIEIPISEIGEMIVFLVGVANYIHPNVEKGNTQWTPIPITGIGLAPGRNQHETILVARLTGFDLAFSLDSKKIAELGESFSRTAQVLAASDVISH